MDHELTAKWHELDKVQVGLKDVVVLHPDLAPIQRQIGDLADLTTEAKGNLVAAINEAARTGGGAGSMSLRVADGYIQYSTDGGGTWQNLIAVAELKGADGADGAPGKDGSPGKDGADGKPGAAGAPGKDGVTPHIGDNGNWYLGTTDTGKPSRGATGAKGDTGATGPQGETGPAGPAGPQGPAGAPGKDGAGMDITGATVGQIAKIAAVGADGVPTKWEPVDMPSGGGDDENFELIMDDTVPANATGYASDKDVNSESFALREWVLILWTPAHTDDDHGNFGRAVGFIPGAAWGKNVFKVSDTIKKSDGTGRYDMLHIKVVDGYQMQLLHTRSQNVSNAFGVMQQDVSAGIAPINFKVDATALFEPTNATGYATCVKIAGYTNENVPAGTHIKLYGKRVRS